MVRLTRDPWGVLSLTDRLNADADERPGDSEQFAAVGSHVVGKTACA